MSEYMLTMAERKLVQTLSYWRKKKGLSLEELGATVGLSKGSMGDYEKGRRSPGIHMAYKLAEALGVELTQVADWIPREEKAQAKPAAPSKPAQE